MYCSKCGKQVDDSVSFCLLAVISSIRAEQPLRNTPNENPGLRPVCWVYFWEV
ncbi:hypothetical protein C1G87_0262 [Dehalococcoides mccartyi]|uniref:Uncharacterized protein n=1 Tax=Dehalococcoides mccartyi TaxID=61435 RepID=A0A328EP06_9CHLR|nr:hypothetical protein C1G87_0262 [Dehalococcoides mccartyi]